MKASCSPSSINAVICIPCEPPRHTGTLLSPLRYMKLALFTLSLHTNYGGILQAYALQTILERMGHQVEEK